jgi:hypothetical protein
MGEAGFSDSSVALDQPNHRTCSVKSSALPMPDRLNSSRPTQL